MCLDSCLPPSGKPDNQMDKPMGNLTKRILASLAVTVLTALHARALTETVNGITWTYTVSNGEASLGGGSDSSTAVPRSASGTITIPATLGGHPVTSIGYCAFLGCFGIRSVTIPNSVTSIGHGAFHGCSGLKSVTIPDSVTSIGEDAFTYCSSLMSVTIPDSVTSIGRMAFEDCRRLTSVTIPSSVTNIGDFAFSYCSGLMSVTVPDSVTSIGMNPFRGCSGLSAIVVDEANPVFDSRDNCNAIVKTDDNALVAGCKTTIIPDSVITICDDAFHNCGLLSVTIPESVLCISRDGFSACVDLSSIVAEPRWATFFQSATNYAFTIPNYVTNIEDFAFSHCGSALTSVTIPNSVTSIGSYAFSWCDGLKSISIPNSVTSIGEYPFSYCSLSSVTIPGQFVWEQLCDSSQLLTNIVIAAGSESIADHAFRFCENLQEVVIPNSVTHIGEEAFHNCRSLTSVTIPDSVTSIGIGAFGNCEQQLFDWETIPGVMLVDGWAVGCELTLSGNLDLSGCRGLADGAITSHDGLTSVAIPSSVTSIGRSAFTGCRGITSIVVASTNPVYDSRNNCNAIIQTRNNILIAGCKNSIIPDSVTGIGDCAFQGCHSLSSMIIPNSVTNIGSYAFQNCSGLSSVTIPDSVTSIGQNAFSYCNRLKSIYLPTHFQGETSTFGLSATCKTFFYLPFDNVMIGSSIIWLSTGDADWFQGQDEDRSFIRSGAVGNCSTSSVETVISGPGILTFDWRVSANRGDYCRLYLDGVLQRSITRSPSWATVTMGVPSGEHIVRWSYERGSASAAGEDAAFLDNVDWQPLTLTGAVDADERIWTTDGAAWFPQVAVSHDGVDAAKRGQVIGDDVSGLETTLTGPGTLSWSWRLDSAGNAGVDVILDGEWLPAYEPTGAWSVETLELGEGEHTVRFEFWNAGTAATMTDCAYLDEVTWTPAASADPIPAIDTDAPPSVVTNAIESAGFADEAGVLAAIGGSSTNYLAFKTWAQTVPGGEAAVVASDYAAVSYLLGTETLFAQEPEILIAALAYSQGTGSAMSVTVVVKDGEEIALVDEEKVASMFEATGDLGDWDGAAKLIPSVSNATRNQDGTMTFTVVPGDSTVTSAFLRIKVK